MVFLPIWLFVAADHRFSGQAITWFLPSLRCRLTRSMRGNLYFLFRSGWIASHVPYGISYSALGHIEWYRWQDFWTQAKAICQCNVMLWLHAVVVEATTAGQPRPSNRMWWYSKRSTTTDGPDRLRAHFVEVITCLCAHALDSTMHQFCVIFFFSLYFCTVSVVSVLVFVAKYETTAGAAHETHTHNCTYANWPHKPSPTTTTIANNIIITLSTLQIYLYFYINECFSLGCCSLSLVFSV